MTNPYDPKGHDRGPVTSGLRIKADHRTHIDRLNGPWPAGPAANPLLELRDLMAAYAAALAAECDAKPEIDAGLAKKRRVRKKKDEAPSPETSAD